MTPLFGKRGPLSRLNHELEFLLGVTLVVAALAVLNGRADILAVALAGSAAILVILIPITVLARIRRRPPR